MQEGAARSREFSSYQISLYNFSVFRLTMLWVFFNRNVEEDSVARMRAVEEALAAKKKVSYHDIKP